MTAISAHLIPTCAGIGGGWRRIANSISVQVTIAPVDGERKLIIVLASVDWIVKMFNLVPLPTFPLME